jgi:hypothetical protein
MDSIEKDTRDRQKNYAIGCLSCCCILLVLFIFSSPELRASESGRFETRVLAEYDRKAQFSAVAVRKRHPKTKATTTEFKTEGKYDADVEDELHARDFSSLAFDELMRRFDETVPSRDIKPKCLWQPKRTRPTIFLSLGRSGSTVILHRLNNMTNSRSNSVSVEYVGQNHVDNLYFFDTTIPVEEKFVEKGINNIALILNRSHAEEMDVPGLHNSEHGEWLVNHICRLERKHPDELVGFKWKTDFQQFWERKEARETLQQVALLAADAPTDEPPIVFLRNRRNMLDQRLSILKHHNYQEMNSRCVKDDEACIEEHRQTLFVPNVTKFFTEVHSRWQNENMIDQLLVTLKLPHVSVSYDKLFYPDKIADSEEQWNSMLQFISPGASRLSWDEIQGSMPFASTSIRNHMELIENWEEVYAAFLGTEVEHLFRISSE